MAEWIRTKDELPEVGKDILGYDENIDRYCVATYSKTYTTFFVGGFAYNNITHWRELPEPPRTPKERGADKPKITCLNCKHLMFSDMYGECNKQLRIVNPSDTCEFAEPKERGGEK